MIFKIMYKHTQSLHYRETVKTSFSLSFWPKMTLNAPKYPFNVYVSVIYWTCICHLLFITYVPSLNENSTCMSKIWPITYTRTDAQSPFHKPRFPDKINLYFNVPTTITQQNKPPSTDWCRILSVLKNVRKRTTRVPYLGILPPNMVGCWYPVQRSDTVNYRTLKLHRLRQ